MTHKYAAISADIASSTSLSVEETIGLKSRIEKLFAILEQNFPGFWGRLVKGDYIECLLQNPSQALRISLIIKCYIKSYEVEKSSSNKNFRTYGTRLAIGIGEMRIADKENGILDGEAIYASGRTLDKIADSTRATLSIQSSNVELNAQLKPLLTLVDAVINESTPRQSEVIYEKLLGKKEADIARTLGIKQSGVNKHAVKANWYAIEGAVEYFETIKFE